MLTMQELINRVERRLSMVVGSRVQSYAEDPIRDLICEKYRKLSRKHWWSHQMAVFDRVLDGADGVVTDNIEGVTQYGDVQYVYHEDWSRPLPRANASYNMVGLTTGGTKAMFIMPHADIRKLVQFIPHTATGNVRIIARLVQQNTFALEEVVPFDEDVLVLHTAWDYATDDATNPGGIEKLRAEADEAFRDLRRRESGTFTIDPNSVRWPTDWYVMQ